MKKIKTIAKNLFGAKRMKTLALMLLCGTIATYAQNAAGDYTAGTDALATVTEEIAKYVPFVVKLCYAIAGVVAVVGAIQRGAGCQEEDNDGRWRMYLPCRSSPGSASVLRYLTYRSSNRDTSCQQ